MAIKIRTFGKLAELIAGNEVEIDHAADTDELKALLERKFPELANKRFFIAVNNKMIQENTMINTNDTVALLPPFSGG